MTIKLFTTFYSFAYWYWLIFFLKSPPSPPKLKSWLRYCFQATWIVWGLLKNSFFLDAQKSKLANLPENLWKLKHLKKLYLSGMSRLEEMGLTGIRYFSSLKYLALADNSFVTLPTSINQLLKLEALDLGRNSPPVFISPVFSHF